jgi:N-acetylmuramoyl-L-alanine amidase
MMIVLSPRPMRAAIGVAAAFAAVVALLPLVGAAQTSPVNAYTIIGLDARRVIPIRTFGNAELVPLDQVATIFGVSTSEDRLTNSVTVTAKGQRIVLTSGQSLASSSGKLVSLSGPVTHDRTGWFVPVDFLSRMLGPVLGERIDVRRPTHTIAVGAAAADVAAPAPPASAPTPPAAPTPAPPPSATVTAPTTPSPQQTVAPDLGPSTGIRTVIIDPGHGGDDAGVHGAKGTLEKDVTLQLARRLKAAIEARLGIRALLTRDADESVSADKRTAFANNARGDLFISLHANASLRVSARGATVFTLGLDQYKSRAAEVGGGDRVPVVGGGTRLVQTVPWDLAQLPFIDKSATFAATTVRHLSAQSVPLFVRSTQAAPLVGLAGINMPAILLEAGFLSNADDEHALTTDAANAIVEALVDTITEIRNAGGAPPESR